MITLIQSISRHIRSLSTNFRRSIPAMICLLAAGHASASAPVPQAPDIAARGYILMDFQSGHTIAEQKADERLEPASLTKMMSAYVILNELKGGKITINDEVLISKKAWRMEGSRTFVEVNTRVPVETLLKGMIIQSGNDATVALAEYVAGDEGVFATLMNQTAANLGLTSSHFVNSTGLPDPDHYTTARDMALLAQALIRDFPDHYNWYSIREFTYNGIKQHNRNKLLWRDDKVDGLKTGHTESAGYCLVASAIENDMRLISVVLGTSGENARARESQKLLNYGFRFFETHRLYAPGKALTSVKVWKGASDELQLGLNQEVYVTIPRGQFENIKANMKVKPQLTAPVQQGVQLGTVEISIDDHIVTERPLVALQNIEEGGLFDRLIDEAKMMFE